MQRNKPRRWRVARGIGLLALGLLALALLALVAARGIAVHRAARDFPPPGQLVDIDGRRSHIHCMGEGAPTVVLESGLDDRGSWGWAHLMEELSRTTRVCAYDRAGFLWSEPREEPRDATRIAAELHALLAAASERPPYVMVGHSLAGLLIRVFDAQYPGEVEGFVFVDASHPDQDLRFPEPIRDRIEQRKSEPAHRWLFRMLAPLRTFAPERPTARTAYWWRSFPEGVLAEGEAIDLMSEQARRAGALGDRPVVVLVAGAGEGMPGLSAADEAAMRTVWLALQQELAALSTRSDLRIVEGAGHYIHWDRPAAVAAAIADVVEAAREGRRP